VAVYFFGIIATLGVPFLLYCLYRFTRNVKHRKRRLFHRL
jgi:hypothetical protein